MVPGGVSWRNHTARVRIGTNPLRITHPSAGPGEYSIIDDRQRSSGCLPRWMIPPPAIRGDLSFGLSSRFRCCRSSSFGPDASTRSPHGSARHRGSRYRTRCRALHVPGHRLAGHTPGQRRERANPRGQGPTHASSQMRIPPWPRRRLPAKRQARPPPGNFDDLTNHPVELYPGCRWSPSGHLEWHGGRFGVT